MSPATFSIKELGKMFRFITNGEKRGAFPILNFFTMLIFVPVKVPSENNCCIDKKSLKLFFFYRYQYSTSLKRIKSPRSDESNYLWQTIIPFFGRRLSVCKLFYGFDFLFRNSGAISIKVVTAIIRRREFKLGTCKIK